MRSEVAVTLLLSSGVRHSRSAGFQPARPAAGAGGHGGWLGPWAQVAKAGWKPALRGPRAPGSEGGHKLVRHF